MPAPKSKTCTGCGETKPLQDFHRQKAGKHGRSSKCILCRKAYYKGYYSDNKTRFKEGFKDGYGLRSPRWVKNLARLAMLRARKASVPFDREAVEECLRTAPDVCPALKIPMSVSDTRVQADSPTLDRIKPELGYVAGNVQVISYRANCIKSAGTPEEVAAVARFMNLVKRPRVR